MIFLIELTIKMIRWPRTSRRTKHLKKQSHSIEDRLHRRIAITSCRDRDGTVLIDRTASRKNSTKASLRKKRARQTRTSGPWKTCELYNIDIAYKSSIFYEFHQFYYYYYYYYYYSYMSCIILFCAKCIRCIVCNYF